MENKAAFEEDHLETVFGHATPFEGPLVVPCTGRVDKATAAARKAAVGAEADDESVMCNFELAFGA